MTAALQDLASKLIAFGYPPATLTDSANGSAVDMGEGEGPCFAVQNVGSFTGDSLEGTIEESPDGSNWTAVDGGAFSQVTDANDCSVLSFNRTQRYIRYVATISGDTPSIALSVVFGQSKKLR